MRYSGKIAAFRDCNHDIRDQRREAKVKAKMALRPLPPPAPILSEKQRREVVEKVSARMDEWRHSAFEWEGAARAALRSSFCLGGNSWVASDFEAERITAAALSANGARRPSWEEGQWQHVISEDYCKWCMGPMEIGAGSRYCGADCAKAAAANRDFASTGETQKAYRDIGRAVRRFANPEAECIECGKKFHPHIEGKEKQLICSGDCHRRRNQRLAREAGRMIECELCGSAAPAIGLKPRRFCSNRCSEIAKKLSRGWQPTWLTAPIFDHFITLPVEATRPKWLTPARFDEMVAA